MMIIMIINIYIPRMYSLLMINPIIIVVIYNNKIRFNSIQLNSQAEYQRQKF